MSNFKLIMTCLVLFVHNFSLAQTTEAPGHEGNGGDGLRVEGKLYLLDLVEQGVEKNPHITKDILIPDFIRDALQEKFHANNVPLDLLMRKMAELNSLCPPLVRVILESINLFSWSWVNHSLIDIKDENSVLGYERADLQQLAIRRHRRILVSRKSWRELANPGNQVALIFHEALYAIYSKNLKENSKNKGSSKVRALVGFLFKKDAIKNELNIFAKLTKDALVEQEIKMRRGSIGQFALLNDKNWFREGYTPNKKDYNLLAYMVLKVKAPSVNLYIDRVEINAHVYHNETLIQKYAESFCLQLEERKPLWIQAETSFSPLEYYWKQNEGYRHIEYLNPELLETIVNKDSCQQDFERGFRRVAEYIKLNYVMYKKSDYIQ